MNNRIALSATKLSVLINMKEFEFEKIIRENLEPIEDIELVILKGHLVMEQLIPNYSN